MYKLTNTGLNDIITYYNLNNRIKIIIIIIFK